MACRLAAMSGSAVQGRHPQGTGRCPRNGDECANEASFSHGAEVEPQVSCRGRLAWPAPVDPEIASV